VVARPAPAPVVSITSPAEGSLVEGVVAVAASVTGTLDVARVDLFVNEMVQGSALSAPYSWAWDTTGVGNGEHTLRAVAVGTDGASIEASIGVLVANPAPVADTADTVPPSVAITTVVVHKNRLTVAVSATDDVGVVKVELYADGQLQGELVSAPYTFRLNRRKLAGISSLQARAYDLAGNVGVSAPFDISSLTASSPGPK
jgi:hypothetical protein